MRFIIFLLLVSLSCYAQEPFSGKILDASSGYAIPFATIGLVRQNTGTNANEKGEFTINCKQPDLDSLLISCIGYSSLRVPVLYLKTHAFLALSLNEKRMKPVVVKNRWVYKELGRFSVGKHNYLTSNGYQSQVARKLSAPRGNTWLQTVHVRIEKGEGKSMFRVRVFGFDSVTKRPAEELTDSVIQVVSKGGTITIDMEPYQVWLPGKDFLISIEWLLIPFNEHHYTAKFEGKKQQFLEYRPYICYIKHAPLYPYEAWGLNYSGQWFPVFFSDEPYELAISATVRY